MLFAAQQFLEGGVWLTLDQDGGANSCFTVGFSAFAQVLWPLYAPFAVWLIVPDARRRMAIALCWLAGAVVGLGLLYGLIRLPITALPVDGHIFYRSPHFDWLYNAGLFGPASALYVIATCGSFMLAGDRRVKLIGAAMAASFALSFLVFETWLISVWCFFAAALSALILVCVYRAPVIPRVRTS